MGSQIPPRPRNAATGAITYQIIASFCLKLPSTATTSAVSNSIRSFDPKTNKWTRISRTPYLLHNQFLKCFSMASINHYLYIIGGRLCEKQLIAHDTNPEVSEIDIEVLKTVIRLDLRTNSWQTCAPLTTPRFDFACTVNNGKIYVAGGLQSTLAPAIGTSSAEVYNPETDTWTPLPDMHFLRYKCVGLTWRGKVHVVGGFAERSGSDPNPYGGFERSSAEVLDPNKHGSNWDLMVNMWPLDVPPNQIVVVGDRLLSSGDCLNAWKGHVEEYDVNMKIWNVIERSSVKGLDCHIGPIMMMISGKDQTYQRLYMTMAAIGTQLYFLAGYKVNNERRVSVVHVFDTLASENAWRSYEVTEEDEEDEEEETMSCERELCGHCCVVQL
ncbi:hypothetical protein Sjap_000110 [Stephania japonica]|uniref:Uncharacterized protein n=1 Tax=Stephania japonica TaxID=461633 RepID=A0AAP0KIC9_9MAGN